MSLLLHFIVPIIHVLSCFFLIVVVLLQTGKGSAFEVMGDRLLCYRRKLAPMEIVTLLGLSKAFLDHVPLVVYSLYARATPIAGRNSRYFGSA